MGSGLPEGSIAAFTFASRITDVVYITFATSIVTVIYPSLSREGATKNFDNFKGYLKRGINNINIIMIPSTIGLIILSNSIITVLFKHGIFDSRGVGMTSIALIAFSVGIPFYGLRDIFNRALVCFAGHQKFHQEWCYRHNYKHKFESDLGKIFGLGGLCLSTSISSSICFFLLMNTLRKKIGSYMEEKY